METVIQDLKSYLQETLNIFIEPILWKEVKTLPIFLQNLYSFHTVILLKKSCILIVARGDSLLTPALVRKHLKMIQEKVKIDCIFISPSATSYNRKRLMKHGVQFIIPYQQVFLPALGLDLLERSRLNQAHHTVLKMMPSSQAVLIYVLTHQSKKQFIPSELAKALNYTRMTMTRALNELENIGLGKSIWKGNERQFKFINDRDNLWLKSKPFMVNPIKKRTWLKVKKRDLEEIKHKVTLSGLSALAERSMLSLPPYPVFAVSMQGWEELQKLDTIQEVPSVEEADIELEIWRYDPKFFSTNGVIDCYSLYMSLNENHDERVEMALEKMLKETKC